MARRLQVHSHRMGARERFEHTEPWGFTSEASGVRTRPDLEHEIGRSGEMVRLGAIDVPAPLPEPDPLRATRPMARPLRAASAPYAAPGPASPLSAPPSALVPASLRAPGPASMPSSYLPQDPPLEATVHAFGLRLPPQFSRGRRMETAAQRIYVLATAVALSVMATAIVFLTMGAGTHGSLAPRAVRVPAPMFATLAGSPVGSGSHKQAAEEAVTSPAEVRPARRRGPAASPFGAGRAAAPGGGSAPGSPGGSAKLDEAARSARMLREQLNSAVN